MNKKQRRVSSILAIAAISLTISSPMATARSRDGCGEATGRYVSSSGDLYDYASTNLVLRSAPSTSARKVLTIPRGGEVFLFGRQGNWAEVHYNGTVGWVCRAYLR
jgi:uncharacterized protein YgiM (DUF1202 family)